MTSPATLDVAVRLRGLILRGAFHPVSGDALPSLDEHRPTLTLILLGFAGRDGWTSFARSREAADGSADPLDRWSRRIIGDLAESHGARALYPFEGPPWHPFGRWAMRAEALTPSPLGILIHPRWGLWHSYRGALAFGERLELVPQQRTAAPCVSCLPKPCLTTCPAGAFTPAGFNAEACRDHLADPAGLECRDGGCLARRACPVRAEQVYGPEQTAFLMRAFLRGNNPQPEEGRSACDAPRWLSVAAPAAAAATSATSATTPAATSASTAVRGPD